MRLLEKKMKVLLIILLCLNPYSTGNEVVGQSSRIGTANNPRVLILILLEMRLLERIKAIKEHRELMS